MIVTFITDEVNDFAGFYCLWLKKLRVIGFIITITAVAVMLAKNLWLFISYLELEILLHL